MERIGTNGVDGQDGYTPVKGVDYWTETEQNEIISTATTNVENNFASTIATIQSNSSNALNTANTANNTANTAKSIAEGANQALSYTNYQAMITAFNELADNVYKVGQNIMIITLNVPDLWISAIENTSITYNYTNDEAITTALSTNGYIQVGYYKLSALETQKVDLTDYYTKTGTENKIEDYLYQIMPTDSASGTIATINDSTTMFNAIDVTGTIEPVQDLHGYDNPWPAGGGKNIINANVVTVIASVDNQYNIISDFITLPAGTYTLSWTLSASVTATRNRPLYIVGDNYVYANSDYKTAGRGYWTFTISEETELKFKWWVHTVSAECTVNDFQLESGSTATSYAPYSNICPITGWTGCEVQRTGKNLLDLSNLRKGIFEGATNNTNVSFDEYQPIKGGQTYVWSSLLSFISGRYLKFYDVNKTELSEINLYGTGAKTFSAPSNARYFRCMWYASAGIEPSDIVADQLELGSTATDYEPYTGQTYPITFPAEAGTVYGGYLDISTGTLVKEWDGIASYSGESLPAEWISDRDVYAVGATPTIGAQVVYKLATPITYQLTPQQIAFLLGTNNLWVDTGDINVTYKADIQKYIDKKTN